MNLNLEIKTADPVHIQIEGFLRRKIETGELCDGYRLPPTRELAKRWHVDCTAIQRALTPLVAQGLIERQRGRGTFVGHAARRATIALLFGPSLADEAAHY